MSPVSDPHHVGSAGWRPVRLRSVMQPFASRIDLGNGEVELWIPAYFGRRRPFAIATSHVAIADLRRTLAGAGRAILESGGLRLPYLTASGELGEPNVLMLFSEPQRLPRVGWRGWLGLPGVPVRHVNGKDGWYVDGVALQVRGEVRDAVAALVAAGIEEVDSLESWVARAWAERAHVEALADPTRAAVETQAAHRAFEPAPLRGALYGLVGVLAGAATWASFVAFLHVQLFVIAIGAGILIAWLVARGAGRLTTQLRALIVVYGLSTVVLGELLSFMLAAAREGAWLGPFEAAGLYLQQLDVLGPDLTFALLGGVTGAAFGLGWAGRRVDPELGGVAAAHPAGTVLEVAATPPADIRRSDGMPAARRSWTSRAGQFVVVGAVSAGLFMTVADDAADGERDTAAEAAGVPVSELRVGDCFDEPSGSEFEIVDVVPCDEPHDVEVFHRFDIPLSQSTDYPGQDVLVSHIDSCSAAFVEYVGRSYVTSELDILGTYPAPLAWATGARWMFCGAVTTDGTKLDGTVRGSGR